MLYYEHEGGKPVSLLELFFDLIFVYAISKLTGILEHQATHSISLQSIWLYILAALVVLQVWLYQTNYNNRFTIGRWYENLVMIINMAAALFLSNVLGEFTSFTIMEFDIAMIISFCTIAILYRIIYISNKKGAEESKSFSNMLLAFILLYLIAILIILLPVSDTPSYFITGITVISGAFLPAFLRRKDNAFDTRLVDFHHLTERFELLTIVTFGEMIVSLGTYFLPGEVDYVSILAFVIVLLFFGCYLIHNHYMLNRTMQTRGLVLMFSHYGIVISLNIITVAQTLVRKDEIDSTPLTVMMLIGTLMFMICLFANSIYYHRKIWFLKDKIIILAIIIIGSLVILFIRNGIGCLIGMLIVSGGIFAFLFYMTTKINVKCRCVE